MAPLSTQLLIDMDDSWSTIALEASCSSTSLHSARRRCAGELSVNQPAKKAKVSKIADICEKVKPKVNLSVKPRIGRPRKPTAFNNYFELPQKVKARLKKLAGLTPPKRDKKLRSFDKRKIMKYAFPLTGPPVRYASDCSGMESFMEAFKRLGVRVQLQFCSDIDANCRTWLRQMHGAQCRIYNDLRRRKTPAPAKAPHIYTAGFPCQPWSSAGKGEGESDSQGRGDLFPSILAFFQDAQPDVFILENVKALISSTHRQFFKSMIQSLKGNGRYYVYWRVFSPQQVGIPQNRPRVFIIGFLASTRAAHHFKWPKLGPCRVGLRRFFERIKKDQEPVVPNPCKGTRSAKALDAALKELQKHGARPEQEPYVIDCHGRGVNAMYDQVPCLTRTRCMSGGYFLTHKQRFMSVEEMLKLQGFPPRFAEKARAMAISPRSLAGMVGNAISVDLLEVLLDRVLSALHMASLL